MGGWTHDFWKRVKKIPGGCWEWQGATRLGYGRFRKRGKFINAHRHAYEEKYGLIPDGLVLRHRCHNRKCVRPSHLRTGTQAQNIMDAVRARRHKNPVMRGAENPNAKLKVADIARIKKRAAGGESSASIARDFPVQRRQISRIVSGARWRGPEDGALGPSTHEVR